MQFVYILLCSF